VYFHHFEILKCICKLRKYSSAGPDVLPPLLFKELANSITRPLAIMFGLFMQFGSVPVG